MQAEPTVRIFSVEARRGNTCGMFTERNSLLPAVYESSRTLNERTSLIDVKKTCEVSTSCNFALPKAELGK